MSNSDSFIEEVTEEVRRDKLYGYLRRYGWIGALVVLLVVGGTAWTEFRKAQEAAEAAALGDAILAAFEADDAAERAEALAGITAEDAESRAALDLITASELAAAGQTEAAATRLDALAANTEVPAIYREIASFRALLVMAPDMDLDARRQAFAAIDVPGHPMRLLASEQIALVELEAGDVDAALDRLAAIRADAEVSPDLQDRAAQVIVALGGDPAPVAEAPGAAN